MADRYQVVRGGKGADLEHFGKTPGPVQIGLDDIERLGVHEPLETPAGVFVLRAGDRDVGRFTYLAVRVDPIGHGDFFDPARVHVLYRPGQFHDVINVHRRPAVEHDVVVLAKHVAQGLGQLNVFLKTIAPRHRPVPEEPFLRLETLAFHFKRPLTHQSHVGNVVAKHRRVGRHRLPGRATDQPVHWLTEPLALQVPQCIVDQADGHHRFALPAVNR